MVSKVKKICTLFLSLIILAALVAPVFADDSKSLKIEQATSVAPNLVAYVNLLDINNRAVDDFSLSANDVSAVFGTEKLTVTSVSTQKDSGYGVAYYCLVDISRSMPAATFNAVKAELVRLARSLTKGDSLTVLTFGGEVEVVAGSELSVEDAVKKINAISPIGSATKMHDAIAKVSELISTKPDSGARPVVLMFTDGGNNAVAGYSSGEIETLLSNSAFPIFAFGCVKSSNLTSYEKTAINKLSEFARLSGGNSSVLYSSNANAVVSACINTIKATHRIECALPTNIVSQPSKVLTLKINVDGKEYTATKTVKTTEWTPDNTAPSISNVDVIDENTLLVRFSENVFGADNNETLTLTYEKGYILNATQIVYDSVEHTARVTFADRLYNGEYVLEWGNIVDISMESNKLENSRCEFSTEQCPKGIRYIFDRQIYIPISVFALLAISAIVLIVVLSVRRKKEAAAAEYALSATNKLHLGSVDSIPVRLQVIDGNGLSRTVTSAVTGSYIIGRSDIGCELSIDDRQLSRQHCALTYADGVLSLQDLESTNGTFLNGLPVNVPHALKSGDSVQIGDTKIVISF